MIGRVLIIAGSDSGGGAGIQADIKTVTALGGYAATAITALTAQDTKDVHGVHEISPDFVRQQIEVVMRDIGADCIKTGMLHRTEILETVADAIAEFAPRVPVVVDPVMVAKGGAKLLDVDVVDILNARLVPMATVLTPNLPEAEILSGMKIESADDMRTAAKILLRLGPTAVLMKGGHLPGDEVTDFLVTKDDVRSFVSPRLDSRDTHGTGCTLSSAIAAGLAAGMDVGDAVVRARTYVFRAIETAPGYGGGHGPMNHAHTVSPN